METETLERRTFLLMLVGVSVLFFYLLKPFFAPIFWACAIGLLFSPLQLRLTQRWGGRTNLVALTTLLVCLVGLVIPVLFLLFSFLQEAVELYQRIRSGDIDPESFFDRIRDALPAVQALMDRLGIDIESIKRQATEGAVGASRYVAHNALELGQGTFNFFLNMALMLYLAFFLLRDGRRLLEHLGHALPLGEEREQLLFDKFAEVTRATVKGNLVVAMVQGALGGLIFWILGLPAPLLWAVVMAALSLIPAVGAALIWLPAAIYLFAVGQWLSATVLTLYGILVIGLADNVLRPLLVGRDTKLPDWLVLLSTLGGLMLFGIHGFVVGPLIAALFIAFWQIFSRDFNPSPLIVAPESTEDNPQPKADL